MKIDNIQVGDTCLWMHQVVIPTRVTVLEVNAHYALPCVRVASEGGISTAWPRRLSPPDAATMQEAVARLKAAGVSKDDLEHLLDYWD